MFWYVLTGNITEILWLLPNCRNNLKTKSGLIIIIEVYWLKNVCFIVIFICFLEILWQHIKAHETTQRPDNFVRLSLLSVNVNVHCTSQLHTTLQKKKQLTTLCHIIYTIFTIFIHQFIQFSYFLNPLLVLPVGENISVFMGPVS